MITKMDLAVAVEFDSDSANANIQRVRPGMEVLRVSSKSGSGIDEGLEFLTSARVSRLHLAT